MIGWESIMKASKNILIIHGYTQVLIIVLHFTHPGPCCPVSINVTQVTQAMTNVTWAPGGGARSYITTLMSSRGYAKCHTLDTHCLMGCITCGTTYSVILEAISSTGYKSECRYRGFSSSEDTYIHVHTHKNIHTGAYLRVWGEGWMIRWDNWCKTICFCNFKGSEQWFGIIEQKFTRTCKHIVQRT